MTTINSIQQDPFAGQTIPFEEQEFVPSEMAPVEVPEVTAEQPPGAPVESSENSDLVSLVEAIVDFGLNSAAFTLGAPLAFFVSQEEFDKLMNSKEESAQKAQKILRHIFGLKVAPDPLSLLPVERTLSQRVGAFTYRHSDTLAKLAQLTLFTGVAIYLSDPEQLDLSDLLWRSAQKGLIEFGFSKMTGQYQASALTVSYIFAKELPFKELVMWAGGGLGSELTAKYAFRQIGKWLMA